MTAHPVVALLERAMNARERLFDARHESAFRLFNGFTEGYPELVIDLYAATLVIHRYTADALQGNVALEQAQQFLQNKIPWLRAAILKTRSAESREKKRGQILFGAKLDDRIREHGVWYSIDVTLNRDTSLYLDTRNLRKWLIENMQGKSVLNMFAYTGSLGVAALAGGASRVVQHDLNRQFLKVAKTSYTLNGFPLHQEDFITADFFTLVGKLKRTGRLFDCVLIDPPFFSTTSKGRIDQVNQSARLINKVRPLINDGGNLITINNALYVSGKEVMATLEALCKDGYLEIQERIPVPEDITGYAETRLRGPVTHPAPFNHSTKIAILRVWRKQP